MLPRNRRVSARQSNVHKLQHSPQRQGPDNGRFSNLLLRQPPVANSESPRESQRMDTRRWKNLLFDNRLCINHPKTALINTNVTIDAGKRFQLLTTDGKVAYEGDIREETTTLGRFGLIDFTSFDLPGEYRLKAGNSLTPAFRIGERLWEDSQWKVLNFIFCQRCGHPVPGKHASCHADLMSRHDGRSISYSGGWHDAGDLSQQTLQTGDVAFALLEAYNKQRNTNPTLAARLREEAEWGVEFMLKNRYGDGYRASSMGLLIWQDGVFNTLDDISSVRVQNMAFDNFLYVRI